MTNKKYILEEIILDKNNKVVGELYNHAMESWDVLPDEEELKDRIKNSISACLCDRKAIICQYTLFEVETDKEGEIFGEWEMLRRFKYTIDRARKNRLKILLHEKFIDYVESCESWNDIEPEEYASHLEDVGLNYYSYDDPDIMFQDYKKAVEGLTVRIEEY